MGLFADNSVPILYLESSGPIWCCLLVGKYGLCADVMLFSHIKHPVSGVGDSREGLSKVNYRALGVNTPLQSSVLLIKGENSVTKMSKKKRPKTKNK